MTYVDGFVLAVPKKNLKRYKLMASKGGKVWMKHGALQYVETVGDDLFPNMGNMKPVRFPTIAKAKSNEVVFFSFIVFKSKAHRNNVNKKVMKDPLMNDPAFMPIPFDMKKMAYAGFKAIVHLKKK